MTGTTEIDLQAFFDLLVENGRCTVEHADHARAVWAGVKTKFPELVQPCGTITEDDAVMLSWATYRVNVSVDVYPDGDCDWFSRDRDTGMLLSLIGGLEVLNNEKMQARFECLIVSAEVR